MLKATIRNQQSFAVASHCSSCIEEKTTRQNESGPATTACFWLGFQMYSGSYQPRSKQASGCSSLGTGTETETEEDYDGLMWSSNHQKSRIIIGVWRFCVHTQHSCYNGPLSNQRALQKWSQMKHESNVVPMARQTQMQADNPNSRKKEFAVQTEHTDLQQKLHTTHAIKS